MKPFSIRESLAFGWRLTKAHSRLVFSIMLTFFGLQVLSAMVQRTLEGTALGAAASLVLSVLGIWIGTGFMVIILRLAQSEAAEYRDLFPGVRLTWRYFLASLVSGLYIAIPVMLGALVGAGAALAVGATHFNFSEGTMLAPLGAKSIAVLTLGALVVVAAFCVTVYFALRFSFVRFAFLDTGQHRAHYITESLRGSSAMTAGIKWRLLGFFIVFGLLNLLGAILLLVGLLVSVPVTMLAYAHIYLKLKASH